jgi:acetolactate synthase-1/2/3 large subunit
VSGTQFKNFAREAKIAVVNLDQKELKNTSIDIDFPINCNVRDFLILLNERISGLSSLNLEDWLCKSKEYKFLNNIKNNICGNGVNPYYLIESFSQEFPENCITVVDGGGTSNQIAFQSIQHKQGNRIIISGSLCSMGSGLPESIGAAFADPESFVVCITGDGSIQMNIQELQTIVHHNLNIKIIILSNDGYLSIRHTQKMFFEGRYLGSNKEGGLSIPDLEKIAIAYGIKCNYVDSTQAIDACKKNLFSSKGPEIFIAQVSVDASVEPVVGFIRNSDGTSTPRPLEDMAPYLDRHVFEKLMCIKSVQV